MKTALVWRDRPTGASGAAARPSPCAAAASAGGGPQPPSTVEGPCHCLCYSPDGSRIVAGVGARVLVYDAGGAESGAEIGGESGGRAEGGGGAAPPSRCRHSLRGHGGPVLAVACAGGAAGRFASGDATGTVVVWTGGGQPVLRYAHGAGSGAPPLSDEAARRGARRGGNSGGGGNGNGGGGGGGGAEPILALAWSASSSQPRLASVSPTELALWDPGASREVVKVSLLGDETGRGARAGAGAAAAAAASASSAAAAGRATRAAAWSPGGRVLALGLSDGSVSLRDGCGGGAELRRVRLHPGPGVAVAAAALAVAWLRWSPAAAAAAAAGTARTDDGTAATAAAAAALAVSTADGRLHEVVLARGALAHSSAASPSAASCAVRSWHLDSGARSGGGGGGGGGGETNAASLALFSPQARALSEEEEEDEGGRRGEGRWRREDAAQPRETLLLLGGACGRVSLVAWRPVAADASGQTAGSSSGIGGGGGSGGGGGIGGGGGGGGIGGGGGGDPFFDLGPFWWPVRPREGSALDGSPARVWALAQRPGGCVYSPEAAGAGGGAGGGAGPASDATAAAEAAAALPAHLPVAHVALGRQDGSVSVVAAHLPTVHALHLSGEHGHVYAAREGLTSVSVRRLRAAATAAAAARRGGGGGAQRPRGGGEALESGPTTGTGVLRFGELVQRVGVYGARVAVQLCGRVEVFERERAATGGDGSASMSEESEDSDDADDDGDGDGESAWSEGEDAGVPGRYRRRRAEGMRPIALRDRTTGRRPSGGGDAYRQVATLVPSGADRLLAPANAPAGGGGNGGDGGSGGTAPSARSPGACSLLMVTARHVVLCSGARMFAYAVAPQLAVAATVGGRGRAGGNGGPTWTQQQQHQRQQQQQQQQHCQQQPPEREWSFDSTIRYVRAAGGPPGAETLLVGLRSGAVAAAFVDRPGALPLVGAAVAASSSSSSSSSCCRGVRCLDLSADRLRLAVVDDSGVCSVYEPFGLGLLTPAPAAAGVTGPAGAAPAAAAAPPPPRSSSRPVWRIRGAESCAWSDAHPDVLAVSGGGQLAVHFVPLVVSQEAGVAALASAAAAAATAAPGIRGGGGGGNGGGSPDAAADADADAYNDDDDNDDDEDDDDTDDCESVDSATEGARRCRSGPPACRRAAGLLAAAALEEGRLLSPPLAAPPASSQDAGGGLVVGLAGATAYVLLRPAASPSAERASSASGLTAAPALAALSVHLGGAVRHLAKQRAALPAGKGGGGWRGSGRPGPADAVVVVAPGLAVARAVACLGASADDWRALASEALDALDLPAAAAAFARLRDARGAELAARLAAAAASGAPPGALSAEVAAWGGRLARASRLFCAAGCPSQAVEMWLAMGRLGPAREVARGCRGSEDVGGGGGAGVAAAPPALSAAAAAALAAAEAGERQRLRLVALRQQQHQQQRRRKAGGDGFASSSKAAEAGGDDDDDDDDGGGDGDDQQRLPQQGRGSDPAAAAAAAAGAAEHACLLVSRGELGAAAACMVEHGLWEQLRALAASLPDPRAQEEEEGPSSSRGGRRRRTTTTTTTTTRDESEAGGDGGSAALLARAAAAFAAAGRHDDAADLLVRLGDTAALVSLHAAAGNWREAALLAAGGGPGLARRAHLPRAAALVARGAWAEAAAAYGCAGLPQLASRLLRSAAASAADAGSYAEAAAWARLRADYALAAESQGAGEGAEEGAEGRVREGPGATAAAAASTLQRQRQQQKFAKRLRAAEAYWAYGIVHESAAQPFAVHPPGLVFRAACFVAARGLGGGGRGGGGGGGGLDRLLPPPSYRASPGGARRLPHGVSLTQSLLTVVRLGPALGEADTVRRACEFLLGLRAATAAAAAAAAAEGGVAPGRRLAAVPPLVLTAGETAEVEMAVVRARGAIAGLGGGGAGAVAGGGDGGWALPCARCGAPAPPPLSGGDPDACGGCGAPVHLSLLTFERLPLVEFAPASDRDEAAAAAGAGAGAPAEAAAGRALALVGRGAYRRCGGGGGGGGPASLFTAEPCGAAEDQTELDEEWDAGVREALSRQGGGAGREGGGGGGEAAAAVRLPATAIRRLRPREVVWRRRPGGGAGDLQLLRVMDGGAVAVAVGASGNFFERDELEAALVASASGVLVGGGGAPSFLGAASAAPPAR